MRNLIGVAGSTQGLPHHGVEHKKPDGDGDRQQGENVVHAASKVSKLAVLHRSYNQARMFPRLTPQRLPLTWSLSAVPFYLFEPSPLPRQSGLFIPFLARQISHLLQSNARDHCQYQTCPKSSQPILSPPGLSQILKRDFQIRAFELRRKDCIESGEARLRCFVPTR